MIKQITPTGRYISVSGGHGVGVYFSPGAVGAGMIRWNTNTNNMEVYDGACWKETSSHTSVGLTSEAEALLDWAREKRNEDSRIRTLMETHPGLKDAWEKFEVMRLLCLENDSTAKKS
jgi:hypothetical protein